MTLDIIHGCKSQICYLIPLNYRKRSLFLLHPKFAFQYPETILEFQKFFQNFWKIFEVGFRISKKKKNSQSGGQTRDLLNAPQHTSRQVEPMFILKLDQLIKWEVDPFLEPVSTRPINSKMTKNHHLYQQIQDGVSCHMQRLDVINPKLRKPSSIN